MGDHRRKRVSGKLLFHEKATDEEGNLFEAKIWRVPVSGRYQEGVGYRLAFVRCGEKSPAVLYDNHHPKGHHRHLGTVEEPYDFQNVDLLIEDFRRSVQRVKGGKR
ncbi:MAG: toxin-antitoxin system TumE family protein [Terriglobia bacterium]